MNKIILYLSILILVISCQENKIYKKKSEIQETLIEVEEFIENNL